MEPKRPRLQRPQVGKKLMDNLHLKFAVGLQKSSQSVGVPSTPAAAAGASSSGGASSSSPSTSSGFVNNPVSVANGVKATAAATAARTSDLTKKREPSRKCLVCGTKELDLMVFVNHVLCKKKHGIMLNKERKTKLQKEERDRRTVFVSGYPQIAAPQEICKAFFELGMIDFHWTKRHSYVEFSTRAEAVAALKKPVMYRGKKLSVAPRTKRCHMDDVEQEELVETLLTPHIKSLIAAPCRSVEEVRDVLEQLLLSIQLRPDECEKRYFIRNYVARILRPEFPAVTCNIFGSSTNNLGFTGADLDLFADLSFNPYDCPRQADGEAEAARLVTYLAKMFRREPGVSKVVAIPRARVPIVKFYLCGVSVDLSFRNAMPIQNSALIKMFTSVHPCVRPYMMFVRFWAKTQNVAGGGKPATLLTNYALTMLMAFVIMYRVKVLPSVAQLREIPHRIVIINGWNCGFPEVVPTPYRPTRNYSVFELALDFFDFYADFDVSRWVICPLLGRLVAKENIASKAKKRLPGLEDYCKVEKEIQIDTPLCVQDPFDLTHNITRGLKEISLERFQLLCRRSSAILRKILELQLPLRALFDLIELSDDAYSSDVDGSEHNAVCLDESIQDEGDEAEVIEIDDDQADVSQEVKVLEEVPRRPHSEPEQVTLDDDDSSQGIKRALTDDSGVSDVSTATNSSTSSVTSIDQKTFLSDLDMNSPYLYKFQVPYVKVVELNMSTGALSCKEGRHSAEDVRWSGLNILIFVLRHVFAAGVISRVTEGEGPSKKMKGTHLDTLHCFGILLVTFKHNLSESRKMLTSATPYSSFCDSPFTYEKSLTDQLLKNMPKNLSHASYGPFSVQFFVCYRADKEHELLLVANPTLLSESVKEQLRSFLHEFRETTDLCMRRALQYLDRADQVS